MPVSAKPVLVPSVEKKTVVAKYCDGRVTELPMRAGPNGMVVVDLPSGAEETQIPNILLELELKKRPAAAASKAAEKKAKAKAGPDKDDSDESDADEAAGKSGEEFTHPSFPVILANLKTLLPRRAQRQLLGSVGE